MTSPYHPRTDNFKENERANPHGVFRPSLEYFRDFSREEDNYLEFFKMELDPVTVVFQAFQETIQSR